MNARVSSPFLVCLLGIASIVPPSMSLADDQPQWGQAWSRNLVSGETNIPANFDPESGLNIKWRARLGTSTHSSPIVAGGRVYIGTNNAEPRDPRHEGDRGVLMCFDESTGVLLWQLIVPKRSEDPYFDWPNTGMSSPVTVEGDRVYIVNNRGELMCLDAKGLSDGNDGPFQSEGRHMTPTADDRRPPAPVEGAPIPPKTFEPDPERPIMEPGPLDADILWIFDLVGNAGIWPHDGAHSSILIRGEHLYLNSGTGVDNTHRAIITPEAPSLVVVNKNTGDYLARDREGIAPNIMHCTWAAPSMINIDGKDQIIFAGGNGIVYGFEPYSKEKAEVIDGVATLKKIWQFDIDPIAPKTDVHRFTGNKREGPSNIYGMPVVYNDRVYVAGGGDLWWGKNESWLKCFNPNGTGDITESGLIWSAGLGRHVFSTPAIVGDLLFQADTSRFIYCFNAHTGELYWRHEAKGDFWASPYVVDGKVYIGTRRGDFWVFEASREKNLLSEIDMGAPISATALAANGTLYVATMFDLFAIGTE